MEPTIPGKGYTNLAKLQAGEEQPLLLNTIQELNILEGEEVVEGSKGLLACLEVVQTCEASIGEDGSGYGELPTCGQLLDPTRVPPLRL